MTKIAVTGSRRKAYYAFFAQTMDSYYMPGDEVCVGDATGMDEVCAKWCRNNNVPCVVYRANWEKHGRAAGPARNRKMIDTEAPDLLLAFPCDASNGTWDCVNYARSRGITVVVKALS